LKTSFLLNLALVSKLSFHVVLGELTVLEPNIDCSWRAVCCWKLWSWLKLVPKCDSYWTRNVCTPAPVFLCQPKCKGRFFQAIYFRKKKLVPKG